MITIRNLKVIDVKKLKRYELKFEDIKSAKKYLKNPNNEIYLEDHKGLNMSRKEAMKWNDHGM